MVQVHRRLGALAASFGDTWEPQKGRRGHNHGHRTLPGILAWAVEGCLAWQQDGLAAPDAVRMATTSYRHEMDVVRRFLVDRCVESTSGTVTAKDLYTAYKKWAEEGGESPMTQQKFGRRMGELEYRRTEDSATRRKMYVGVTLEVTP